ncbi:hypothetical protein M9H77_13395 [Catharanthus roseus]|uniref:Uncharacterized protein n=1 Tax=Catharanthus roseus TaxID=4058 RepID=A0ACC0BKB2_CATRO|nr:hypothetical protein M9H77_13395 [Catharanthus roseus]
MLNRISFSIGTLIPVSLLLLDTLEIKELSRPPTGGVGEAVDFRSVLRVSKSALKTKAFQEACVFSVIEELTEHLAQWSYSVAFYELSFIPAVRLRKFCKSTKFDRSRCEMRQLIRQLDEGTCAAAESNVATVFQRDGIQFQRAQQRYGLIKESSLLVGEHSSTFGNQIIDKDEEDGLASRSVSVPVFILLYASRQGFGLRYPEGMDSFTTLPVGNEKGVAAFNSSGLPESDPSSDEEEHSMIDNPDSDNEADDEPEEPAAATERPNSKRRKGSSKFTEESKKKTNCLPVNKSKKRKRRN